MEWKGTSKTLEMTPSVQCPVVPGNDLVLLKRVCKSNTPRQLSAEIKTYLTVAFCSYCCVVVFFVYVNYVKNKKIFCNNVLEFH